MANISRPSALNDSIFKNNIANNKQGSPKKKETEQDRVDMYNIKQNQAAANAGSGDWKPKQVNSDKDIADEQKRLGKIAAGSTLAAAAIPAALTAASALGGAGAADAVGGQVAKKGAEKAVEAGAGGTAGKGLLDKAGNLAKGTAKAAAKGASQFVGGFERGLGTQLGVSRPSSGDISNKQGTGTQSQDDTSFDDTAQNAASSTASNQAESQQTAKTDSANTSATARNYAAENDRARQAEQIARNNVQKQREMASFKRDNENYQKRSSNIWNTGWD